MLLVLGEVFAQELAPGVRREAPSHRKYRPLLSCVGTVGIFLAN